MNDEYVIHIPLASNVTDECNTKRDNFGEVLLYGKDMDSNKYEIHFKMSKEALIGFATYAIRTASYYDSSTRFHLHVDPLGNPSGSQPMGFFLTSKSPSLVLSFNDMPEYESFADIASKTKPNKLKFDSSTFITDYQVLRNTPDTTLEFFEIGFKNLVEIVIFDETGTDVTKDCINVVFKMTEQALRGLASEFIKLAHSFVLDNKYTSVQLNYTGNTYDLGFYLLPSSCKLTIVCSEFENVYYYEPKFGTV